MPGAAGTALPPVAARRPCAVSLAAPAGLPFLPRSLAASEVALGGSCSSVLAAARLGPRRLALLVHHEASRRGLVASPRAACTSGGASGRPHCGGQGEAGLAPLSTLRRHAEGRRRRRAWQPWRRRRRCRRAWRQSPGCTAAVLLPLRRRLAAGWPTRPWRWRRQWRGSPRRRGRPRPRR